MMKKSSISIYNYELTNMQGNSIYFFKLSQLDRRRLASGGASHVDARKLAYFDRNSTLPSLNRIFLGT